MPVHRFTRHYTREEARSMLPQVRHWLENLSSALKKLETYNSRLEREQGLGGDLGGPLVDNSLRALLEYQKALQNFQTAQIQVKDVERGLVDFPAFIGGREVFLCWEKEEEDIEFWHDVDTGYAGRERI